MKNRFELLAFTIFALSACRGFETQSGEPNNVIAFGDRALVSLGSTGVGVYDFGVETMQMAIALPDGLSRVDDLALADDILFVLDAADGRLTTRNFRAMSIATEPIPNNVREVDVGPYSGVSAAGGLVVVSGGTSDLTVLSYDERGALSETRGLLDTGRGQPDVIVSRDGTIAYVSSDFSDDVDGHRFGITSLALAEPPEAPRILDRVGLEGAGFTGGTGCPANFPIESAIDGDHLFVAHGNGLAVIEVREPSNLVLVTVLDLGVEATSVDVFADRAFVVGAVPEPTYVVVDITDPTAPTIEETVALDSDSVPTGVAAGIVGNFIAANSGGLIQR